MTDCQSAIESKIGKAPSRFEIHNLRLVFIEFDVQLGQFFFQPPEGMFQQVGPPGMVPNQDDNIVHVSGVDNSGSLSQSGFLLRFLKHAIHFRQVHVRQQT